MPFWKRKAVKRRTPEQEAAFRLRRRAFLTWAAATVPLTIVTYKGVKYLERKAGEDVYNRKVAEANRRPPLSTRHGGAREIIEGVPEISTKEMSWYKPGRGQLRESDVERHTLGVDSTPPQKGDRSKLHSHPYDATRMLPKELRVRFVSNLSPADVREMVELVHEKNPVYTSHAAAVDASGIVMGYVSYHLSKRLVSDSRAMSQLSAIGARYDSLFGHAILQKEWSVLEKYQKEYVQALEEGFGKNGKYSKNGLLIHHTPMPEYAYKDGEFRLKE